MQDEQPMGLRGALELIIRLLFVIIGLLTGRIDPEDLPGGQG